MQLAHYRMIKVQDMTHMNSLKYIYMSIFIIFYHYIDTVKYIIHAHEKIERHPRILPNHRIDERIN